MSMHSDRSWSYIVLFASTLAAGCVEEPEAFDGEGELEERDLSLCSSVPAHATVTLDGPGTYSEHAPNALMTQPGCNNRFIVDFNNPDGDSVHLSSDLIHFFGTTESWAFTSESTCVNAFALMDVYTKPQFGPYTQIGSFTFQGEFEDGVCTPIKIDGPRVPTVPGSVDRIRLATRAWTEQGLCMGGSGPTCIGGTFTIIPTGAHARATVVVP